MKKLYAGLIGVALAGSIVGAVPATAAPTDLQVQARFVSATCQGGDFANVKLTAASRGGSGTVQYAWDFTNNGSFDTAPSSNPVWAFSSLRSSSESEKLARRSA